ncbi:hypothetical protein LX97_03277 [Nonlabens dokdonensis]|uniref:Outer membrane lipoprotein n=3 Tax=Nonlabens dokdonensis TaxID=328515 RepID=A0ABX5PTY5_9FLAO|nr:putative outer membrane lipoprotein [Nonlabens dokdonensis DSW-6]PZX36814.1 hypothetical protein LX97_03277 [Nonlabens dokdonensis]
MLAIAALAITSCGDDDDAISGPDLSDNQISGVISESKTLTNDRIWNLQGRTTVTSGAVLTIEPGTIIKGLPGQGANASVLIIARGASIQANGTAAEPIIFTSIADNIALGQTNGPNLNQNDRGLWGGVIVLGNAPSSLRGDVAAAQIEGIPASDTNGLYGGSNPADNSGVMNYVSIRHGGTNIGEGNEINGLTLGGVGTGTTISNIEVVANVDDGIEFFGGTVNASNLFVWAVGDDAIDIDQAYSGTITNAGVVLGDISDHAFEIDGPEGSLNGSFTINNATIFGNANTPNGEYADYRSRAQGATNNVYATGFKSSSDVELDNNGVAQNYLDGDLTFSNWVINLPSGVAAANDIFVEKVGCAQNCDDEDDANDIDENTITSFTSDATQWATAGTSGGADLSAFSWTYSNATAGLGF